MDAAPHMMLAESLAGPIAEAAAFLRHDRLTASPEQSPGEAALRRAFALIAPDLDALRSQLAAKESPDILALFGARVDDKLAALLLLAGHRLRDAVRLPEDWLEIKEAAHDLALYLDILFRAGTADGLGYLYDFAAVQLARGAEEREAQRWRQVCQRCLCLMAMLPDARAHLLAFLAARESARRLVEQLMASADPGLAAAMRALGDDYVQARKQGTLQPLPAPAASVLLARGAEGENAAEGAPGLASLLVAHGRIRESVNHGNHDALLAWMARGSPAAAADAFRVARSAMPAVFYARLLEEFLRGRQAEPVRRAAAVLELGALNRASGREDGEDEINRILYEVTLTDDGHHALAARIAINELGKVGAFNLVLNTIEYAPIIEVAEEAMRVLRDLRRLLMAETIIRRRTLLAPAFDRARDHLRIVQNAVEAAFSAPSADAARLYIDRLRELKATPELHQLSQKRNETSALARQSLSQLRLDTEPLDIE